MVIDLDHTAYLDSVCLHVLLTSCLRSRGEGGTYRVINAAGVVRRVLDLTGATEIFGLTTDSAASGSTTRRTPDQPT